MGELVPPAPRESTGDRGLPRRGVEAAHALLAMAALTCVFVPVALLRPIDGDEGFYLVAARLVGEGKLPYEDFFFLQMPGLPYLWGAWLRLSGESWAAARILSAVIASAIGGLLFVQLRRAGISAWLAGAGVAMYASSAFVLGWFPLVKAYGISVLLLLAAELVVRFSAGAGWYALAGVFVSLSVQTRLYFAAVVPVFIVYLWRRKERASRGVALFVAGGVVAAAPSVALLVRDPAAFLFGNVYYHAIRSGAGFVGDFGQKLDTLLTLVPSGHDQVWAAAQLSLLVVLSGVSAIVRREGPSLSRWLAVVLGVVSFLPTPSFTQYFCVVIPFLIEDAVRCIDAVAAGARTALVAAGAFVVLGLPDVVDFVRNGTPGVDGDWSISAAEGVATVLDEIRAPLVLASWPGYLVGSSATPMPSTENNFGWIAGDGLSRQEQDRFHVLSSDALVDAIRRRTPPVVVTGNWTFLEWMYALPASGYVPHRTRFGAIVWLRAEAPPPARP